MITEYLRRNKFFKKIIYKAINARARNILDRIQTFLDKQDTILDIGSGSCIVCEILSENNYNITPLDVQDLSFTNSVKPVIYDGNRMPFDDGMFVKSLMLTVLHHTPEPEKIILEAKRVSKRIIIIEDIYSNWFHKYMTYFFDSLLNLEFFGHPHTNKNDTEWKKTFEKLGLKLIEAKYNYSFFMFRHATYYLEKV